MVKKPKNEKRAETVLAISGPQVRDRLDGYGATCKLCTLAKDHPRSAYC